MRSNERDFTRTLWFVAAARWIPPIAFAVVSITLAFLAASRSDEVRATISSDLKKNHRLTATDLGIEEPAKYVGQYLKVDASKGSTVNDEMVSGRPIPDVPSGTVAAIIVIEKGIWSGMHIVPGDNVQLCLGQNPFGAVTRIAAATCDENICEIIVNLPPKTTIGDDADVFANLSIVDGELRSCAKIRPSN